MAIEDVVRERGPLTVAAFMDLALYDSEFGYYARAAQRSGRAGDFFTSVDVGPVFGELLAVQIAEMADLLAAGQAFDLVEAGAGNGRLSADVLRATRLHRPDIYACTRLHLVESSREARSAQSATLGTMMDRVVTSSPTLPDSFTGVLIANELLDALPTHQVVMRADGLREVYVEVRGGRLAVSEGPLSTSALREYLGRLAIQLEPGWRVEINLHAVAWIQDVARRLERGFVVLIDYGHQARELYSGTHATGTLTTFARHTMKGPASDTDEPSWLQSPGAQDITAHVDFTSVRAAAEEEGLMTLGFLDQTYFLMGLMSQGAHSAHLGEPENFKKRLALKTLLMPGGLGSTHKVLIFGKDVDTPTLRGCSYATRVT